MCCNCRKFSILYKLVSFTLAGITSHILTWFLCAANAHFLTLLSEMSFYLKYEASLKYCTNSLVECQQTLSPTVVLTFPSQRSNTTLVLGTLTQRWWKKYSQPCCVLTQLRPWKSRQRYFGRAWPPLKLHACLWGALASLVGLSITATVWFGNAKTQHDSKFCFIAQKLPLYLLM